MEYEQRIREARTIADIFTIVKDMVEEFLGRDQAGLMVGLSDLGAHSGGFIGAYYSLNANMIIINRRPLERILQTNPSLYNYDLFHVMLHEYIHSIGLYDEAGTRLLVNEISTNYFGRNHEITQLGTNIERFFPNLTFPGSGYQPPGDSNVEFIHGIDRANTDYIQ